MNDKFHLDIRGMSVDEICREMRRTCGIIFSERRKALAMTQLELAKAMGCNRSTIARKEVGLLWVAKIDDLALEAIEFRAAARLLLDGSAAQWNEGLVRLRGIMDRVENTEQGCSEGSVMEHGPG